MPGLLKNLTNITLFNPPYTWMREILYYHHLKMRKLKHRINNLLTSYNESLMELGFKPRQSGSRVCSFHTYAMLPLTLVMYSEKEIYEIVNFVAFFACYSGQ